MIFWLFAILTIYAISLNMSSFTILAILTIFLENLIIFWLRSICYEKGFWEKVSYAIWRDFLTQMIATILKLNGAILWIDALVNVMTYHSKKGL